MNQLNEGVFLDDSLRGILAVSAARTRTVCEFTATDLAKVKSKFAQKRFYTIVKLMDKNRAYFAKYILNSIKRHIL